jgi:hypothetical protein
MVNVRQPFVPRQVSDRPNRVSLADARHAVPESATWPRPSPSFLEVHAAALQLRHAIQVGAAGIAAALQAEVQHAQVEAAPSLLRVAEAKFASLLAAPDPPRRGGSGATGKSPDTNHEPSS